MSVSIQSDLRAAFAVCMSVLLLAVAFYSHDAAAQQFPGEEFGVVFSTSPDRSGGLSLNGATVSGDIYVFTSPITPLSSIARVKWYLDTPSTQSNLLSADVVAPYDFQGGSATLANPFDTRLLADGEHTIIAKIVFNGNPRVRRDIVATFTVNNSGPPPGLEPWEFGVADLADRVGADAALFPDPAGVLELLFGQVFIFIGEAETCTLAGCVPIVFPQGSPPPPVITQVTFTFDIGTASQQLVNIDTLAPFDLGFVTAPGEVGDNATNPGFNLDLLQDVPGQLPGVHTLTAEIETTDGVVVLTRAFLSQPLIVTLPPTLKGVVPLEDTQLAEEAGIINLGGRDWAVALGKAFFWDLQTGGDGRQACASCHYHAGIDNRILNTANPGPNGVFDIDSSGPGGTLTIDDFNFHQFADILDRNSAVTRNIDDIVGSQGLLQKDFVGINEGSDADSFTDPAVPDLRFVDSTGTAHRRSTGRNTPTNINAIFNVRSFWDGRANFVFNGQNPFGTRDPGAVVYVNNGSPGATPVAEQLRIRFASLASQAVGPANNAVEMSYEGRTFPELGRKLLNLDLQPLAKQLIASDDSVLGAGPLGCLIAGGATPPASCAVGSDGMGLALSYSELIMLAFDEKYWNGADVVIDGVSYTQMEANFSMFWGLAIQLWEATLVSDDSKWDRFRDGDATTQQAKLDLALALLGDGVEPGAVTGNTDPFDPADILTNAETRGMQNFLGGECNVCHGGAVLSAATTPFLLGPATAGEPPEQVVERMLMEQGLAALELGLPPPSAMYDIGFYNIGVRPTTEDLGIGGVDDFGNPLSFSRQLQSGLHVDAGLDAPIPGASPEPGILVVNPNLFVRNPGVSPIGMPVAVNGSFKVPTLRNIDLTAPYMHNGGHISLTDVVAFYARGADFFQQNIADLDPAVAGIGNLRGNPLGVADLVDFMLTFTDPRVREEAGPFDHPSILLENGIFVEATGTRGGPVLPTFEDRLNGPTARPDIYAMTVGGTLTAVAGSSSTPGVLDNDSDGDGSGDVVDAVMLAGEAPAHGILTSGLNPDGSFEYTPDSSTFRGIDGFAYDATTSPIGSEPRSNVARVTIKVGDDVPVGNPDFYEMDVGTSLVTTAGGAPPGVLDNDTDDFGPLTAAFVSGPSNPLSFAVLSLSTDGSFTYTPDPAFVGTDTFTYTPQDAGPGNVTTVTIEVKPDVPVGPPCPADGVLRLCYSLSADRSDPLLLNGATVTGTIYVFVTPLVPAEAIIRVKWYIDTPATQSNLYGRDERSPYDFSDCTQSCTDPTANPLDTTPLTLGAHTIIGKIIYDTSPITREDFPATFTVE